MTRSCTCQRTGVISDELENLQDMQGIKFPHETDPARFRRQLMPKMSDKF